MPLCGTQHIEDRKRERVGNSPNPLPCMSYCSIAPARKILAVDIFQESSWNGCCLGRGQACRRRSFPRFDRLGLEEPSVLIGKASRGNKGGRVKSSKKAHRERRVLMRVLTVPAPLRDGNPPRPKTCRPRNPGPRAVDRQFLFDAAQACVR